MKIRFTQPKALNDPFESRPLIHLPSANQIICDFEMACQIEKTIPEIADLYENHVQKLKEKASPHYAGRRIMDAINKQLGILSLSKTKNNLLMWSHYADSHKGFVIGFDETHDFFHPKNGQNPINNLRDVNYASRRSVAQWETNEEAYLSIFFEKPKDWDYEKEVRVIRHFNYHSITVEQAGYPSYEQTVYFTFKDNKKIFGYDGLDYPIYLFDLPKECIKCVYLGANAQPKLIEEIIDAIKSNNLTVELYETKMSETQYELEFSLCSNNIQHSIVAM
ncbi:MAG: DUF2971 domain-containing protein [Methylococcales bacterium]|nr:DUF2971 domain-containing protein [Methylococcales bacterium]